MDYRKLYPAKVDKSNGVKYDQTVSLNGFYISKNYPKNSNLDSHFSLCDCPYSEKETKN